MSQPQAEAVHDRYRKNFAGRSRATRDVALLDSLIAEMERLVGGLEGADRATAEDRLGLYRAERKEIAAIQAGGALAIAAWRAVEWSEVANSAYRRHFAGKNRATRDLGLLGEIVAEEKRSLAAIPAKADERLAARRQQMEANLRLYEGELKAIPDARAALAPVEQARVLATAANQQFDLWRRHFQGKARATRRPALLQRMIDTLEGVRARMAALQDMGLSGEPHASNLAKVAERVGHYRSELEKIRAARLQVNGLELARRLGDEANAVFAAYRTEYSGKPRTAADPERLSGLCDELGEVARAMRTLEDERPVDANARNLTVVLDHLKMMEREHVAILEARATKR